VLTGHGGLEERAVLPGDRVEPGDMTSIFYVGPAQVIESVDGLAFWLDVGQGFKVASVRLLPDLQHPAGVGHAFAQGHPPPRRTVLGHVEVLRTLNSRGLLIVVSICKTLALSYILMELRLTRCLIRMPSGRLLLSLITSSQEKQCDRKP